MYQLALEVPKKCSISVLWNCKHYVQIQMVLFRLELFFFPVSICLDGIISISNSMLRQWFCLQNVAMSIHEYCIFMSAVAGEI